MAKLQQTICITTMRRTADQSTRKVDWSWFRNHLNLCIVLLDMSLLWHSNMIMVNLYYTASLYIIMWHHYKNIICAVPTQSTVSKLLIWKAKKKVIYFISSLVSFLLLVSVVEQKCCLLGKGLMCKTALNIQKAKNLILFSHLFIDRLILLSVRKLFSPE